MCQPWVPPQGRGLLKSLCALPISKNPEMQVDFHTEADGDSDIAFHFRVSFGLYVRMNSRQNGSWNCEVKSSDMPFADGQPFELHILVLQNEYQVRVPGTQLFRALLGFPRRTQVALAWPQLSFGVHLPEGLRPLESQTTLCSYCPPRVFPQI